jgi:hypothetical protein
MLILKLYLNKCDKHVALLLVMGHAVNTYLKKTHTYIHMYVRTYTPGPERWSK